MELNAATDNSGRTILGRYLCTKHHDEFNNDVQQEVRLRGVWALRDYRAPIATRWHHVLHIPGCARAGRAAGADGHSPDLLSTLPGAVRAELLTALCHAILWPERVDIP